MFSLPLIHWLVVISALINGMGAYAYIRDTLSGRTQPNRVSWSLWALAPLIGTAAALSAGADIWATVRVFLAGFLPFLVFLSSFVNRRSYWKITVFDMVCGVFSVLALILWLTIDASRLAIVCAVIADGWAGLPTLIKAWKHPETETGATYAASFLSLILVLPAIPEWNIENAAFQLHLLIASLLLLFATYRKRLWRVAN